MRFLRRIRTVSVAYNDVTTAYDANHTHTKDAGSSNTADFKLTNVTDSHVLDNYYNVTINKAAGDTIRTGVEITKATLTLSDKQTAGITYGIIMYAREKIINKKTEKRFCSFTKMNYLCVLNI